MSPIPLSAATVSEPFTETSSVLYQAYEWLHDDGTIEQLVYWRRSSNSRHLAVFLPGAGHLARVAYGWPGADQGNFIDHWLKERQIDLLAVSYPGDHPSFARRYPQLTLREWAASVQRLVKATMAEYPKDVRLVLVGWSMGGKLTSLVTRFLTDASLPPLCFISLAAVPPLIGLASSPPGNEVLTGEGLWDLDRSLAPDGRSLKAVLFDQLAEQYAADAELSLRSGDFDRHVRMNTPLMLRGEPARLRNGQVVIDAAEALDDLEALNWGQYPFCGNISPTSTSDIRFMLAGDAYWHLINMQHSIHRARARSVLSASPVDLHRVSSLSRAMTNRTVRGSHFFFLGPHGARATVAHIEEIISSAEDIERCWTS